MKVRYRTGAPAEWSATPHPLPPQSGRVTLPGPAGTVDAIFRPEVTRVPERDDRSAERRRPAGPAWATVPTTSWKRVVPGQREESVEQTVPISPGVGPVPPVPRRTERPAPPVPRHAPARQILGPP